MATGSNYPLVDLSDIPGCDSPTSSFRSSTSTVSKSTKSRISSIFSSASLESDDDPFDLKASARKPRPNRSAKINTGMLIEIEGDGEFQSNPSFNWELLKKEAQAIAVEMNGSGAIPERIIDFDEMLKNSPLNISPLCSTKQEDLLVPSSPKILNFDDIEEPRKSITHTEKLTRSPPLQKMPEIFIDDQLEAMIASSKKQRKPLSVINGKNPVTRTLNKTPTPVKCQSRLNASPSKYEQMSLKPMTSFKGPSSSSKYRQTPLKSKPQVPSKGQTPKKAIPTPTKCSSRPSVTISKYGQTPVKSMPIKPKIMNGMVVTPKISSMSKSVQNQNNNELKLKTAETASSSKIRRIKGISKKGAY